MQLPKKPKGEVRAPLAPPTLTKEQQLIIAEYARGAGSAAATRIFQTAISYLDADIAVIDNGSLDIKIRPGAGLLLMANIRRDSSVDAELFDVSNDLWQYVLTIRPGDPDGEDQLVKLLASPA